MSDRSGVCSAGVLSSELKDSGIGKAPSVVIIIKPLLAARAEGLTNLCPPSFGATLGMLSLCLSWAGPIWWREKTPQPSLFQLKLSLGQHWAFVAAI